MPHQADHDVIIIGADFAGLYMLYRIPGKQGLLPPRRRSLRGSKTPSEGADKPRPAA